MESAYSRIQAQIRDIAERTGKPPRYLSTSPDLYHRLRTDGPLAGIFVGWVVVEVDGKQVDVFPVGARTEWPRGKR